MSHSNNRLTASWIILKIAADLGYSDVMTNLVIISLIIGWRLDCIVLKFKSTAEPTTDNTNPRIWEPMKIYKAKAFSISELKHPRKDNPITMIPTAIKIYIPMKNTLISSLEIQSTKPGSVRTQMLRPNNAAPTIWNIFGILVEIIHFHIIRKVVGHI